MSVIKDMTYPYIETKMKKEPAISLDEIKSYLKLHQSNVVVDNELSLMYETALSYAEKYSRRLFTPTEVKTNRLFWGELRNGDFKNIFTLYSFISNLIFVRIPIIISFCCIKCFTINIFYINNPMSNNLFPIIKSNNII